MRNMKKIRIRKGILILGIVILVMAIGFFNRKYFSHEIAKQDYMDPVYGEGSLDGWKFQFDMYTNNPGENAVDKTNSVSTIEHEFQSESEYKYITFQISYTYTGQDSFAPGTLKIYVPKYKEGSRDITYELISPTINIAAGSLADGYEWNYSSQIIDNNSYYVFTNNKQLAVEEGKDNLQGMFQIAYAIEAEDVYIRYDSTTQQEKPSYKEFNAKLVNTVDDNSLTSDTKKVTLDFPKATYKIRKSANKIKSLDGLPSDDYIWVNYKITSSKTNGLRGIFRAVFGDFQDIFLIKETLPSENCILLDDKMNEITSDSNDYYIKSLSHEDAGDLNPQWSFYIGYPISEFDGETITNTAQFYGQYTDATLDYNYYKDLDKYTHEVEYIAEDSIEVDLNKFKFVYPPGNYGLVKHVYSSANTYYKQHDSETMDFKKIKEASDRNTFFIRPITNYTGTTLTVRIGDDREYIESADGTKKEWLSDNDYYFSYINLPILKNGNGNPIKTYQAKLFVRYAGTNNYVLYSNNDDSNAGIFDTSARKEFNFNETNIVGWYIEIYNMKESIKDAVSLSTRVNYSKEDIGNIGTKGYLYNFAYFDVYDDQGNLLNGASESSYTGTGYNDGLAQWDYETYGHYPRRDYAYVKYNYPKEGYYIYKSKRGEKYELDRWKAEFYFRPYHIDSYGYKRDTPFTKIDMYDLLPAGMYLESPIINVNRYYDYKNYTINGEKPSSNDELIEFLKSHTSYEIKYNWNNTGRTWIHVYSDFTDVDFRSSDTTIPYEISFKAYIPYESIPEYGLSYNNRVYINLEPGGVELTDDTWEPSYSCYNNNNAFKDSGYYDSDAADINENGSTTDLLNYNNESTTLLEAYASQGSLTKYVRSYKMEGNNKIYNNEWADSAITEPNGLYEYKNRFYNSTESSVTNVVIYDNLESYYYDHDKSTFKPVTTESKWQGSFQGIDTSYLEAKGYTVRTYYSTNEQAGSLKNGVTINPDWKLLTTLDTVNYSTVKSLAFEILDSQGRSAIIPPDTTLYVIINMKAPSKITAPYAYNGFWTEWNAIDSNGQILSNIDGLYGNIVEVKMNTANVTIEKVDEDGNSISGANLQILDENNEVVYSFTSGTDATILEDKLVNGKEYTLHEVSAPAGYVKASDVTFTADNTQTNQTVTMTDPKTKVSIIKQDENGNTLAGAVLQVKDGITTVEEWTTTTEAHSITGKLVAGKTYKLHEVSAPDGYVVSADKEFTVNNNENVLTVTMSDPKTKVNIVKKDSNGNGLAGAVLQVKDGSTVIDSWTSTTSTHEINGVLTAGKTYTLEEVTPPNGYAKAVSKQFTVPTDGSDITVTMSDTKTKLEVTKVDSKNNNISGVVLQILDATDNSVVQEWTTTNNPKTIEGLTAGHGYILHEVSSPDGYALSDDISFTMNTDIGTQQIVMTDEVTKVYIKKVNVDGEEIEGAKLQILSGSIVIDEWTTTAGSTHEIIGVLGAGKTYKLHEVSVPKGYVTAEDKEFTVPEGNETLEVEMLDNKTKVSLIKLDMKSGRPLAGSHLQVLDKDKNIIFEFVSTEEKVVLEGLLEVGETYHLHEAGAPNLYQRNVDVEFTVGDTAEEIEVEISDDKTLLSIEKTDEKGNKISGALLQIIDEEGNVVKEFTSSEKAEELYGVLNELEIYTLHEEKAPEGYLKAKDIKFKIDEEGKVNIYEGEEFKQQEENVIKMKDEKIINPETSNKGILIIIMILVVLFPIIKIVSKKISTI